MSEDDLYSRRGAVNGPGGTVVGYVVAPDEDGNSVITFAVPDGKTRQAIYVDGLREAIGAHYLIERPEGGFRSVGSFDDPVEKFKLRPIAETLAMLAGNAFFDMSSPREHYEYYLPEAAALYEANGGDEGWAGLASFARRAIAGSGQVPPDWSGDGSVA